MKERGQTPIKCSVRRVCLCLRTLYMRTRLNQPDAPAASCAYMPGTNATSEDERKQLLGRTSSTAVLVSSRPGRWGGSAASDCGIWWQSRTIQGLKRQGGCAWIA